MKSYTILSQQSYSDIVDGVTKTGTLYDVVLLNEDKEEIHSYFVAEGEDSSSILSAAVEVLSPAQETQQPEPITVQL